ncbi:MAG: FAD-dependent oxidoreductase [Gemmatimonadaceae bacterium]
MPHEHPDLPETSDRALGIGAPITRKDFLNTALLGVGAALLGAPAPAQMLQRLEAEREGAAGGRAADPWTGPGGVGDYAASNGNTRAVLDAAHKLRDGAYARLPASARDTGEVYDLVIVGGGISGLTAAYTFTKATGGAKTCLILENHPVFGGEAKENEFVVNGVRLIAPQASNQFGVPRAGSGNVADEVWTDLGLPRQFAYGEMDASLDPLRIPLDNYAHMDGVSETQVDVGYFFDRASGAPRPTWVRNIWANDLAEAPFPDEVKRDLLRWRTTSGESGEAFRRRLDTMSYQDYLERVLGLRHEVTEYITPVVGLINGATPDAVSAFAASQIGMPGVSRARPLNGTGPLPQSFPGGNSTYARHFVKYLVPGAISGERSFEGVLDGRVAFSALDRAGQPTRIRLGAIVVRVEHENAAAASSPNNGVRVAYEQGGRVNTVRARTVVMASGGWINKHVIADLPAEMRSAYDDFHYTPALVINVALTNWRFLYKLGAPSCRWFGNELGFSCNIRRPMQAGSYHPPLHPGRPTVLTFYMGLYTAGRPAAEQGQLGRARLLSASYAQYERRIREHMARLFTPFGFDPRRDIAGIILNRWGHARQVQPPGWYFGRGGQPAAREVIAKGFGRVAIGHSELNGHQSATGAMAQGKRAAEQVLAMA